MTRRSTSVSFDEETWELVQEKKETENTSLFVRNILRDYLSEEDGPMEEINRLRRKADELEEKAEEKRRKAETLEKGVRAEEWIEQLQEKENELQELENKIEELKDFEFDSMMEIENWAREELKEKGIGPDREGYLDHIERKITSKVRKFGEKQNLDELSTECDTLREEITVLRQKIPDEELEGEEDEE